MKKYIPINKKTGQRYPEITEDEMKGMLVYKPLISDNGQHKYRFEEVVQPAASKVKEPVEAKKDKSK